MRLRTLLLAGAALAVGLGAGLAQAANYGPGVTDKEIKLGGIHPYSGPASAYGTIGKAVTAYFRMINEQGGINGRKINYVDLDDGYSPPKTVEQARKLVEQEQVLAIFNSLGTPTNTAIHKYMNAKKVPQIFVATGASKWGHPEKYPWTMGWQPTYPGESANYAAYLGKNKPDAKVAILYQNDDYGKDYLDGFIDALGDKAKKMVVAKVPYEVTDPTVDPQIIELKNSGADTFFNITTPKFAAQAIRKAYDSGWKPLHFLNSVSSSVGSVLKPAGLDKSTGLITAYYLKDPTDPQWAKDADFKAWSQWMDKYYPDGDKSNAFNVYGYSVAATMAVVLKNAGDNLTRENLMKTAANLKDVKIPMVLPGITVNTSAKDFYPLECEQLSKFDGHKWVLFGDIICPKKMM
ncbi:MAG TPA: ABC transporter substrate-binding protein [Alphaproteobacteria bacterium]|jgi:ABC-type branched-subunit amino acid transport system substrate-binding protein|nr:ABC transporter substrate-binding protein [Alphaproteobacteria bacterium]